ncbi:PLP-dependent aminotransferase family protein [Burkholderia dolosa]|uniref:PLP-dependent aminotransferase family protein n=1 Tax=Burkholderia dolosa TaxID=152500 RepID=A0A892ICP7_9BURK|nr:MULTISPECIES: PLP-dependent aminotransferase family protein [Burkholderia]AKE06022.1 DNA-binding protein [Burkholderia cepacia]AJY09580.1 aminotransferase class I and II family protein [Burkholderia dolosa AU0158]AYZ93645.1 PLP-dependent aminotransferase family protein [Burkholderia dolosa]ETP62633.1 DNA-binding protein [Burkholderia dolosa PC543]MBR8418190.1 PLP-dependent aminotransferase family protein [Burkholderia dolosa]
MTSASFRDDTPLLPLDAPLARTPGAPSLQRQLLRRVRDAILGGAMPAGTRLPGTRALAEMLGVSRNTTAAVYEQLVAEGFLQSDRRGTRVVGLSRPAAPRRRTAPPAVAQRLGRIRASGIGAGASDSAAFRPGVPALAQFPVDAWRHAIDRALRRAGRDLLAYGDPLGEPALRESIARHLAVTRGVRCEPEQIVITEGAQGAISLCVQLLTNPGDTVWIEEPGYRGARSAMQAADLDVVPMPVDAEGLRAEARDWRERTPRVIYTTPSNQFPTGAVLSISRRLALIDAARRHRAWIVEDDYDSEFRHTGEPIGAMHGLAADSPVVYLGSFSKTMFPALRIGFLVLPDALLAAVRPVLPEMLRGGPRHVQLALADFIETGEYGRHLGRMRRLYRDRRRLLLAALDGSFGVPHRVEGGPCGLHLTLRLPARYRDRAIVDAASAHGIGPFALSGFATDAASAANGLVLGFGNTPADAFEPMLTILSGIARRVVRE